ncbi:hypothetical protein S349_17 [Shewanella sp. phage 3/49]|uniref:hypothetical protein n=1 Tax=Shewanella sp. phage 3/49 TaxID=1458863 RepID=UPI0004F80786|nr:hypothetical protein S349_17 [Shewanella sp. phage 3/49]AHK11807.1 hypothetical protein S349_17 [Shewanella sp. phage 3/49]
MLLHINKEDGQMSKFKVGDKVKRVVDVERFIGYGGPLLCVVSAVDVDGTIRLDGVGHWFESCMFELIDDWTIYNNDKPLSELPDEQLLSISRHKLCGGEIERYDTDNGWLPSRLLVIAANFKYRAKQKSERELFVEDINKVLGYTDLPIEKIGGELFNAGFKAPKVSRDTACSDSKVSKVK